MKYAFNRFDTADLSHQQLARELEAKGFPAPDGGWNLCSVTRLLQSRAYTGTSLWGTTAAGKYHEMQGGEIVAEPAPRQPAQTVQETRARRHRRGGGPSGHHLRGFVRSRPSQAAEAAGIPTQAQGRVPAVRADLLRALRPAHVWGRDAHQGQGPPVRIHAVHLFDLLQPQWSH